MKLTLEKLVDAIRKGASTDELKRMVGPTAEEAEVAQRPLAAIDSLDAKCDWASMTPDFEAQQARDRREILMRSQGAFESQYG